MSQFIIFYAECHYAECHYAECRYPECRYAECRGARKMLVEFLCVQNKNVQLKFLFQLSPFHPTNFMLTFFLDNELRVETLVQTSIWDNIDQKTTKVYKVHSH